MSSHATAPSPPETPYRHVSQLRRSRTDRTVAGVAGGLGRYAGIDPLIFRVMFVLLAIFGAGSGILLYLLGWLFVPEEGEPESEGQRLLSHGGRTSVWRILGFGLVALVALGIIGAALDNGPGVSGFGVIVVLGVIGYLLLRQDGHRPGPQGAPPATPYVGTTPATPYAAAPTTPYAGTTPATPYGEPVPGSTPAEPPLYGPVPPPADFGQTAGTAYREPPTVPPAGPAWTGSPPPVPPRERSPLGLATVSIALLVVGGLAAWNSYAEDDVKVVAILASALAVLAGGLLVGAFAGRARWLVIPAIPLALMTAAAGAVDAVGVDGGVGERDWRPVTVAAAEEPFRLGFGEARLDLRALPAASSADVDVELGVGELTIYVPEDARVVVRGEVAAGEVDLFGQKLDDGPRIEFDTTSDPISGTAAGVITIDAEVGLGSLEVVR